jgi:hypothetical protein
MFVVVSTSMHSLVVEVYNIIQFCDQLRETSMYMYVIEMFYDKVNKQVFPPAYLKQGGPPDLTLS